MLKERKFSFKFYSGKEDDLSIENDILSFTGMRQRYNEKETCNALMNAIKHKNGENLFLKVIYFDENGEESHQRLDLKNSITRDLSNTKVRTDDLDSNYEIGISFDIVTNDEDNSVRGSINVKFIFDLSPRELKEKYHGKEITVDGETYKIEYDTENHSLIIKGEYGALVFDFFLRRIKVNFDTQFTLLLDEESNIEFQGEEVKFYNLIKTFIEKLSVL